MDSQHCRLCLQTSEDVVNIWKTFQDSTIATILKQHFWFLQVNEDDGLTEWLCQLCWVQTKAFHVFYRKVEQCRESYSESIKNQVVDNGENVVADAADTKLHPNFTIEWKELKSEVIDSVAVPNAKYTKIEPDLTIEETEFQLQVRDSLASQADDIDHDWDEESRYTIETRKRVDKAPQIDGNRPTLIKVDTSSFSQSDELINQAIREERNRELNGQIREWFTMKCDICDVGDFDTLQEVKRHYRKEHQLNGYLKCCDQKFRLRCELLDHIRYHILNPETAKVDAKIYAWFTMKCDICDDVSFKTLLDVRRHYRSVHTVRGYLTCCDKKFVKRNQMVAHMRGHIKDDDDDDAADTPNHKIKPSDKVSQIDSKRKAKVARSLGRSNELTNRTKKEEVDAQIRQWFTMECDICKDVSFKTLLDVRRHYREVHKVRGYLACCNKKFHERHSMAAHMRRHTNPDTFRCEQCERNFKTKYSLTIHIANHVPLHSRAFKCSLCSRTFATEAILRRHTKTKHPCESGEKFLCEKCNKNYRSELLLKCHIRHVHESHDYVCEVCARQFKSKHALSYHIISEHSNTPQPKVQCNICGNWLKNDYGLAKHVKEQHHDAKPANCPVCSKIVANKHRLGRHIRMAHGEKKHACVLCDKAFRCANTLKEHLATHTGEDLYQCPYCDKKFKSNANMYSHRKKAHLAEWTRENEKNLSMKNASAEEIVTKVEN